MEAVLTRYVVLPEHAGVAIALWLAHTYTLDAGRVTPYLAVLSPVVECGKTTLLTVIRALARRSILVSDLTAAALFRMVDAQHPTLIIDEKNVNSAELQAILNSGHTRSAARVARVVQGESRTFSTFCPKAIARVGTLPPSLASRSISVLMQRRISTELIEVLPSDENHLVEEVTPLRQQLARWGADHLEQLRSAKPIPAPGLENRSQEIWTPLLAISEAIGGLLPERARAAAQALSGSRQETLPPAIGIDGVPGFAGINVLESPACRVRVNFSARRTSTTTGARASLQVGTPKDGRAPPASMWEVADR